MKLATQICFLSIFAVCVVTAQSPISVTNITHNAATLNWTKSGGDKYDVECPFGTARASGTNDASLTISGLSASTNYSWRVRVAAKNPNSQPGAWVEGSFTTLAPPLPAPSSPPSSLSASPTSEDAVLFWNSVTGASWYDWEVYDEFFTKTIGSGQTTSTTATVTGLQPATKYKWRIRAGNASGSSPWNSAGVFTTPVGRPKAPSSLSTNETTEGAQLTWHGVAEAKSYDIQILESVTFTVVQSKSVTTTSATVSGLSSNTKYYAQVRSVNEGGASDWIQRSFTTLPLSAPTGLSAAPSATSVTLSWASVAGAKSYVVEIHDKPNYNSLVKSAAPSANTATITGLSANQDYYWQVKAKDLGGEGAWAKGQFKTSGQPPPVPISLTSIPTSSGVTLGWSASIGATSYVVEIHDKQNYRSLVKTSTVTTNAATVIGLSPEQTYYWQVKSVGIAGESDWAQAQFTTAKAIAAPVVLVKEAATTVTFTFTAYVNATSYDVRVLEKQGGNNVEVGRASTTDATKPVVVAGLQPKSRYEYEATVTASGQVSQPATGTFTTLDASTLPPAPSVTFTFTASSVTFVFTAVANATSYDVRILSKQGGGTVVGSGSATDPMKPIAVTGLEPKTRYDYEATVTVSGIPSQPATGTFTTLDASTLPPAPSVTFTFTASSVTFVFTAVANATSYDVRILSKQGGGTVVGSGSTTDPTKPIAVTGLEPKTRYDYEATVTVSGIPSQPATGTFTTLDASTRPRGPVMGIVASSKSVIFNFTPVSGATLYEVKVLDKQSNGDVLGSGSTTDPSKPVEIGGLQLKVKYYYEATVTVDGITSDPTTGSFSTDENTTAVERRDDALPGQFSLSQNYPNPFNPSTSIEFSIPTSSHVRLTIYDALGTEIQILVDGSYFPGRYHATWDAAALPSGVYFYRLQTPTSVVTKKLMLVK